MKHIEINVTAYHGSPNPNVRFTTEGSRVIYFTSDPTVAESCARAEEGGGLLPRELLTLIFGHLILGHPLVIHGEEQWEQLADHTVINKAVLCSLGYDSILSTNEFGVV